MKGRGKNAEMTLNEGLYKEWNCRPHSTEAKRYIWGYGPMRRCTRFSSIKNRRRLCVLTLSQVELEAL
jgi:hypothetical protein